MANMSYCRFRNTLTDLSECLEVLESGEGLSNEEYRAALDMIEVCREIIENEPVNDEGDNGEYDICTECHDPECGGC